MIAVIFEVWPNEEHRGAYLDWAARLRPELERMEGFLSIERFESLTNRGQLLSHSFWRDEECLARWRQLEAHRAAQAAGRKTMFRDYHLRIASVIRDYGLEDRAQAPEDSRRLHG
jgi:heme-degrading monooxygenase HmoA